MSAAPIGANPGDEAFALIARGPDAKGLFLLRPANPGRRSYRKIEQVRLSGSQRTSGYKLQVDAYPSEFLRR